MKVALSIINGTLLKKLTSGGGMAKIARKTLDDINKTVDNKVNILFDTVVNNSPKYIRKDWKRYTLKNNNVVTHIIENSNPGAITAEFGSLKRAPSAPIRKAIQYDPLNIRDIGKKLRDSFRRNMNG